MKPFWNDLNVVYIGPHALHVEERLKVVTTDFDGSLNEGLTCPPNAHVYPRMRRWDVRAFLRAMYEAELLRRQKLFQIQDREGQPLDPFTSIDFMNYYPINRPTLPELLSSYAFHLRLSADQVLRYDEDEP